MCLLIAVPIDSINITRSIVFQGVEYATIRNDDPRAVYNPTTNPCESRLRATTLPPSWSFASNSPQTAAAIIGAEIRFNSRCLVLADGSSMSSLTGLPCSTSTTNLIQTGPFHVNCVQAFSPSNRLFISLFFFFFRLYQITRSAHRSVIKQF